jgi:hypothetical protein
VAQDWLDSLAQEILAKVVVAFLRCLKSAVAEGLILVIELTPGRLNAFAKQNGLRGDFIVVQLARGVTRRGALRYV